MKFKLTGLPTEIKFTGDSAHNEQILQRLSYYTLCKIADQTHMSSIRGMSIELTGKTLNLDECGNFLSIGDNKSLLDHINPNPREKALIEQYNKALETIADLRSQLDKRTKP